LMPAATSWHESALRLDTTTLAPCSARRSTIALPMPLVEPVTRATFPVRSKSVMANVLSDPVGELRLIQQVQRFQERQPIVGAGEPADELPQRVAAVQAVIDVARIRSQAEGFGNDATVLGGDRQAVEARLGPRLDELAGERRRAGAQHLERIEAERE